ncbi:glycosyltransferase family 2 protein [Pacificibacter maritimus]|nr:glycosyltransferase family 2 protein [Pacificibacter maritimus]
MRYTVATKVKNEGAYLLEWVAWQKMLGFDDILVVHNDCDPIFKEMLYVLENAGWITAAEHFPDENTMPGPSAQRCIQQHPLVKNADWFFLCDVDEYLVIHADDPTVQAFLQDRHLNCAGIIVQWKTFGTGSNYVWEDALLHRTFVRAAKTKNFANAFYKTFLYQPRRFKHIGAHEPRDFLPEEPWGERPNVFERADGQKINFNPNGSPRKYTKPQYISHEGAQVNHYITKWFESFSAKAGARGLYRKSNKPRYSAEFFERYNRNETRETSARKLTDRFQPIYDALMTVPDLKALHHLNCAQYVKMLNENTGSDPRDDSRYIEHMATAKKLRT